MYPPRPCRSSCYPRSWMRPQCRFDSKSRIPFHARHVSNNHRCGSPKGSYGFGIGQASSTGARKWPDLCTVLTVGAYLSIRVVAVWHKTKPRSIASSIMHPQRRVPRTNLPAPLMRFQNWSSPISPTISTLSRRAHRFVDPISSLSSLSRASTIPLLSGGTLLTVD